TRWMVGIQRHINWDMIRNPCPHLLMADPQHARDVENAAFDDRQGNAPWHKDEVIEIGKATLDRRDGGGPVRDQGRREAPQSLPSRILGSEIEIPHEKNRVILWINLL